MTAGSNPVDNDDEFRRKKEDLMNLLSRDDLCELLDRNLYRPQAENSVDEMMKLFGTSLFDVKAHFKSLPKNQPAWVRIKPQMTLDSNILSH